MSFTRSSTSLSDGFSAPTGNQTSQLGKKTIYLFHLFPFYRAHLQRLRGNEKIKEFTTDLQFMMKSSPPATEKKFQLSKKQEGGSFYAFHGSPFSNWHCMHIFLFALPPFLFIFLLTFYLSLSPISHYEEWSEELQQHIQHDNRCCLWVSCPFLMR